MTQSRSLLATAAVLALMGAGMAACVAPGADPVAYSGYPAYYDYPYYGYPAYYGYPGYYTYPDYYYGPPAYYYPPAFYGSFFFFHDRVVRHRDGDRHFHDGFRWNMHH